MSLAEIAGSSPHAYKPRREKMFGEGRLLPLDRNAKARVYAYARAKSHRIEKGKHYGEITAKFLAVLGAILYGFHNSQSGRCFPSYEAIAERAHCHRCTVYEAIHALEAVGVLTWVNRIVRIREWGPDLFGRAKNRWRVIRTSNQYCLIDPGQGASTRPPQPSKSDIQTGTPNQETERIFNPWGRRIRAAQLQLDLAERRERWGPVNDVLRERGLAAWRRA